MSIPTVTLLKLIGVPDWARWIAVDHDGETNVFSAKPTRNYEKRWIRRSIANNWHMQSDCSDESLFGTCWRIR